MSYLIDTHVLSELRRSDPDPGVVAWFAKRPASTLFLSVLTLGEIRKGIDSLPDGKRRLALRDWLETELPAFFAGRLLGIDAALADRWGRLLGSAGRPLPAIDSLLAATALHHGLALITHNTRNTRNLRDVDYPELEIINPWQQRG